MSETWQKSTSAFFWFWDFSKRLAANHGQCNGYRSEACSAETLSSKGFLVSLLFAPSEQAHTIIPLLGPSSWDTTQLGTATVFFYATGGRSVFQTTRHCTFFLISSCGWSGVLLIFDIDLSCPSFLRGLIQELITQWFLTSCLYFWMINGPYFLLSLISNLC